MAPERLYVAQFQRDCFHDKGDERQKNGGANNAGGIMTNSIAVELAN